MQRILFIILLFTGYIYSQQVQPLVADTNSSGAYDVNHIKILGTKNDATHHRLPVDINGGTINATITGGATSANQALLKTVDSLIQVNTKRMADSLKIWRLRSDSTYSRYKVGAVVQNFPDSTKQRYKVGAVVQNFPSNPTTSIRQDTLLALLKYLGRSLTTPYFFAATGQPPPTRDSISGQTAKVIDVRYSNGYYPTKVNWTATNLTGTADTIRLKTFCVAKNDSSYYNAGWKDRSSGASGVGTADQNEPDNSLIIIPANTSRSFESDGFAKVGVMRFMWKTNAGKSAAKLYLSWTRIN
jgi:hypothetical protein